VFGDVRLLGELYKPDLLLIPIGGGQLVMNPADAALATRELIKPKMALAIHYGTTPALVGTPEEYVKALGSSSTKVLTAKPGDRLEF
jgi:L-ascorbate metabolism protein UlaG (beta-lactamase superfamily)